MNLSQLALLQKERRERGGIARAGGVREGQGRDG